MHNEKLIKNFLTGLNNAVYLMAEGLVWMWKKHVKKIIGVCLIHPHLFKKNQLVHAAASSAMVAKHRMVGYNIFIIINI